MAARLACPGMRVATMFALAGLTPVPLGQDPAHAYRQQPLVSCTVADHNLVLDLLLRLRPDGGADPAGMEGELQIHHPKLPHDRRRWSLDKRQPAQFWMHGNELRLRLVPAGGEALVELVIETQRRAASDDAFSGTWALRTAEAPRLSGRITCSVAAP